MAGDTEVTLTLPLLTMPVATTVAGGDRVMAEVLAPIEPMSVPAGMVTWLIPRPLALIGCPTAMPVMFDTPVTRLLPAVRVPVGEITLVLAVFDIVTVPAFGFSAVMNVPWPMPVPEIGCPATSEAKAALGTPVMIVLLLVRLPVMPMGVEGVVAVALADMVISPVPTDETVVFAGIPVPVIGCPAATPVVLSTDVMLALPLVRIPVYITGVGVAVAAADNLMVVPLADATVVPAGMPAPLIGCPATTPVMADTPVTETLPLVT